MLEHGQKFVEIVNEAKRRIVEIGPEEVERKLAEEKFHLVDVREDGEWSQGHIPGAVHLGKGILERDVEAAIPDTGSEIVLYCGGGYRSALAADNLQKMGYTRVKSMSGGFRGWKTAGFPVTGP